MTLPDEIRDLAERILGRLDEARDYYLHTREAWRVVQRVAQEGRSVGIVNSATGQDVPASDLKPIAQRYVSVHLTESVFKGLCGHLEDWVLGLARLWLTAYPVQLDAAYNESTERSRSQRREEIQVPLSEILAAPDRAAILEGVVERVVRELAYRSPLQWFRFLDNRVNLGCPDDSQKGRLCEMKAARDTLEHSGGLVGSNYIDKAGTFARYAEGEMIQIEEPYLLDCFALLQAVVGAMTEAAFRKSSGSSFS
jgi:hypothetical protein